MTWPVDAGVASGLDFTVEIDATRDLPIDTDRVEALVTVTARPSESVTPATRLAEVLIMDRSLSMQGHNKIHEAHRAACAAIDALPDGVMLGIIAGNQQAEFAFSAAGGLAQTDARVRADAKRRVMTLLPEGGTRIGQWLVAAKEIFSSVPEAGVIRHAVLYTDGRNEHETRPELDAALARCADLFTCDVRGLGEDWDYNEVRHIADALRGGAKAVVDVADLTSDFTEVMHQAARLVVPRTYLRLRLNENFEVVTVERVYPDQADLTTSQRMAGDKTVEVALGAWAAEQSVRRYQLSLHFTPAAVPVGTALRAARVDLLAELPDGTLESRANEPLVVVRHDTPGFKIILPDTITRVYRERELRYIIQDCINARIHGHIADADEHLERALRLARQLGDERLPLLEGIAVTDAGGKVRVRPDAGPGELQRVGLYSTMTTFKPPGGLPRDDGHGEASARSAPERACAKCGTPAEEDDAFCTNCGEPFKRGVTP
jgi:Ca-activated chloride channel family protein